MTTATTEVLTLDQISELSPKWSDDQIHCETKGGRLWRYSEHADGFVSLGSTRDRRHRWERLVESAKTLGRYEFVANYVVFMSAKKENLEHYRYSVTKVKGGLYQIWFGREQGKLTSYLPMNANSLCEWMERLPLRPLMMEGEHLRIDVQLGR